MNYYNEFDPYAAQWLRNLVSAGLIPPGHVDERSITDVTPSDLSGFTQCHFFAGIGGWSLALKLAGIDPSTRLWTGSCPCQPFSAAGKRKGTADERHLWPVFRNLIAQCNPPIVFGEQVASSDGRAWLSTVRSEMEALGYAFGASDLCAAGIGAPHIRQRLYFVGLADAQGQRYGQREVGDEESSQCASGGGGEDKGLRQSGHPGASGDVRLADANSERHHGINPLLRTDAAGWNQREMPEAPRCCKNGGLANSDCVTMHGAGCSSVSDGRQFGGAAAVCTESAVSTCGPSTDHCHWGTADWLWCRDGKWRPAESGTFPLANGIPGRMGRLRAYGNAIVPQVAATFIKAALNP